jgi:hypothetical protein
MEPNRSRSLTLLIALLACSAFYAWQPVSTPSTWRLSVEVAQVRVSVGVDWTVRNRTLLSEIVQFAARLAAR